jgi:uncharacterized membrane protein
LFGFISIFLIYHLARQLFNRDVGLLSALLMALSLFHIHYSQEARQYALVTLLTLTSSYPLRYWHTPITSPFS